MIRKNKFAILGVAGFIAKKHVSIIKKLKCNLVMASDTHDNVGFLDSNFPNCLFYKSEKIFFSNLKKNKISHVIICTPNHLHLRHIENSFKNNCHVICEKPTVLNLNQFRKVEKFEKKYKKKCFPIFQLRENKKLINLKKKLKLNLLKNIRMAINIKYITTRGNWYLASWKGDERKSGGLILNIGIHFIDILSWFFGKCTKFSIKKSTKKTLIGKIQFKNIDINVFLSTESKYLKNTRKKSLRVMMINNKKINFTEKFNDLHLNCYKKIIKKNSILINDIKNTYYNLNIIQNEKSK